MDYLDIKLLGSFFVETIDGYVPVSPKINDFHI